MVCVLYFKPVEQIIPKERSGFFSALFSPALTFYSLVPVDVFFEIRECKDASQTPCQQLNLAGLSAGAF